MTHSRVDKLFFKERVEPIEFSTSGKFPGLNLVLGPALSDPLPRFLSIRLGGSDNRPLKVELP